MYAATSNEKIHNISYDEFVSNFQRLGNTLPAQTPTTQYPQTSVDPIDSFLKDEFFDREIEQSINESKDKGGFVNLFKVPFKTNIVISMNQEDESFSSARDMANQWVATPMNVDVSSPEKWILPNMNEETSYFNVRFIITRHFYTNMGASPSTAVILGNMIMGKLIFGTSYGDMDVRITELVRKLHPQIIDRNSAIFL